MRAPYIATALLYITLLGFIPYLVLVWRAHEMRWSRVRGTILTFALLLRFIMLAMPAPLSTDTARYLWEGRIQVAGYNPYACTPNSSQLESLRDKNWDRMEHRDVESVYPPLLLMLFRVVATVAPHRWMFRFLFMVFDMFTFRFLVQLLRARKQNESLALIWALNPLVILEFANGGHETSLAIAFFIAGLWMLQVRLTPLAALAFGLATLSHLLALPLAMIVLITARIRSLRIWLWFTLPIAFGYLLYVDAGSNLWHGLFQMAGLWRFNGSVYELLAGFLDRTEWQQFGNNWVAHGYTKLVSVIVLGAAAVWLTRHRINPIRSALTLAGCILLVSSTVHPWYATWLVALVCLEFSLPWLMFSAVVMVSYIARIVQLQTGIWVDAAYTRWLEYIPLYALLLAALWRNRFDSAAPAK